MSLSATLPATIGTRIDDIDTPALLIDLDAFERNLKRMAQALQNRDVRLRPHAKTHKSAVVAQYQIAHGAVGVCCQKVGEAEAMVHGGVHDVLVSNQIVGAPKLTRLAALARQARIAVCVDNPANIADLDEAAKQAGSTLDVLVEIDVGARRCGVQPGPAALDLARQIEGCQQLNFRGLQAYHGSAQHLRTYDEREQAIKTAADHARRTRELLQSNGIEVAIISGAGTGTYAFEASSGVYNELQAGSYIFMDADYGRNLKADGQPVDEFEHSLFVLATVMSIPNTDRAVVDAGLKALSMDSGPPTVCSNAAIEYIQASDEHGVLNTSQLNTALELGVKLKLIPGHCDPTVNLYDWYVGVRGDRVESLWPVSARGALL